MKTVRELSTGLTLVELMLALVVSSIAVLGAVRLYAHAGTMFRTVQSAQSLEETAQLALMALRHDIERAGFVGPVAFGELAATGTIESASISVRNDCGDGWAIRFTEPVGGNDDGYRWDCPAFRQSAAPGADTLVLRYVEPEPVRELETGRVYLRTFADGAAELFVPPDGPGLSGNPLETTHALRARGYYVSTTSAAGTRGAPVPSLRVKQLTQRAGQPVIVDEEIQPGVEDLQIEYGTAISSFAPASEPAPADRVRAVRIWLLVRSQYRENGLGPNVIPAYARRGATVATDGYRRSLVTTTIAITDDRPL